MAKGKGGKGGFIRSLFTDASLLFWRIFFGVVLTLTLFILGKSLLTAVRSHIEIYRLNRQKREYMQQITADSTIIEQLKYEEYLEKYAREKYNMQRQNERVYIIE